jgi:hypothetical protein
MYATRGANRHGRISNLRLVAQLDAESLGHSIERAPVDAEHIGRARPIASDRLQHVFEVPALHFLERREIFKQSGRRIPPDVLQHDWEVVGSHHRAAAEQHDAFDGVFQLPNVAGPVVREQHIQRTRRKLDLSTRALACSVQERRHQQRDVVPPFPECRQSNDDHAEAIVQIGPELLLGGGSLQIAVGGCDDPIVDLDGTGASDWPDFSLLEDPQLLDLEGR